MTDELDLFSHPKVLIMVGGGCLAVGVIILLISANLFLSQSSSQNSIQVTADQLSASNSAITSEIWVDVSGAVVNPGLYSVTSGARISDVIEKAGGLSEQADTLEVAQQINLAQKVQDAEKVFIPFKKPQLESIKTATSNETSTNSKISINSASTTQLQTLEGIGESRASNIIENRPYQSIDQLVQKKIISQNLFEKIKNQLTL